MAPLYHQAEFLLYDEEPAERVGRNVQDPREATRSSRCQLEVKVRLRPPGQQSSSDLNQEVTAHQLADLLIPAQNPSLHTALRRQTPSTQPPCPRPTGCSGAGSSREEEGSPQRGWGGRVTGVRPQVGGHSRAAQLTLLLLQSSKQVLLKNCFRILM